MLLFLRKIDAESEIFMLLRMSFVGMSHFAKEAFGSYFHLSFICLQTHVTIISLSTGTGVLSLPQAFSRCGWVLGTSILIVFAALADFSLVRTRTMR